MQKRDLALFRDFVIDDYGQEDRPLWTPRLSKAFADHLKKKDPEKGRGGYSDRAVNRILAHLKTFAKWIHKLKPFPLDNPMVKTKLMPVGTGLFEIVPVPFRDAYPFGGGLHCATTDVYREGNCEDCFPKQVEGFESRRS